MKFNFMTPEEWQALPCGQELVFDIEIFKNFLFIAFKVVGKNYVIVFSADENYELSADWLRWFVHRHKLIGFNSENFDMPILTYAMTGAPIKAIHEVCNKIIKDNLRSYEFYKDFQIEKLKIYHTDLMQVCPLKGGLKLYGARLHAHSIEEMPTDPANFLTPEQKNSVALYCVNDLALTELIKENLDKQLKLREQMSTQYQIDLMSASDAQIAEKVMTAEIKKVLKKGINKPHIAPGFSFEYDAPDWIMFCSEPLQKLFEDIKETDFVVNANGYPELPEALEDRKVKIGNQTYKIGLGGLHSTESCQAVKTGDGSYLIDVDVASYYPAIILNNGFYPEHLGEAFLEVYQSLVTRRLKAKAEKRAEADSLKITINGLFGKFGSKWSNVYSPKLLLQVTLTGQLALLMLIECAEMFGIEVVSANTDGVVFHPKNKDELDKLRKVVAQWGAHTSFNTEETEYSALYSRDVNNYIAVKKDGKTKTKGTYLLPEGVFRFHKNPDCTIISQAVINYVAHNKPVRETIEECKDIREFLIVRTVKGGAVFTQEDLGKIVRWYYSRYNTKHEIEYKESGNKVPRSLGAKPLQELPGAFPDDVDIEKYVELAQEALYDIGAAERFDPNCQIFSKEELDIIKNL